MIRAGLPEGRGEWSGVQVEIRIESRVITVTGF